MDSPLIQPVCRGEALKQEMLSYAKESSRFHIWWLGQSGFLLAWDQHYFLFDPYLSDSLTRKYASTDKPHIRMTALAMDPSTLGFVQVVTSSHQHTDHLDADTLKPMIQANPDLQMVIPASMGAFAADRLGQPTDWFHSLDAGFSTRLGPFHIHAVPAAHEELDVDDLGRHCYLGYVVEFGPWAVYHSGDTLVYDGLDRLLSRWSLDLALLPINGRRPERKVSGNMWGDEAASLAKKLGVGCVIPCHYDMFTFNTESPKLFMDHCRVLNQPFKVLQTGGRWSSLLDDQAG